MGTKPPPKTRIVLSNRRKTDFASFSQKADNPILINKQLALIMAKTVSTRKLSKKAGDQNDTFGSPTISVRNIGSTNFRNTR